MQFATADDILALTDPGYKPVFIPAINKHVVVVGMSGKSRDSFEASLIVGKGKKRDMKTDNIRAKLAARCCYSAVPQPDGSFRPGVRLFTDDQADKLGDVRADVLAPIFDVAQELSGVSDEDLEEMGKPSETTTLPSSSAPSRSN